MVATKSTMLALGTAMPEAVLFDGRHHRWSTAEVAGQVTVIVFMCNHCPFVAHIRRELVRCAHELLDAGGAFVAINSNSVDTHPQDGPGAMAALAESEGFRFPYLFDRDHSFALALSASCTPDFYVFGRDQRLVYRGRFDASTPVNKVPVSGNELRAAIDATLDGRPYDKVQEPSLGCNIKWDPGLDVQSQD
ncbi:MAG TPA: thioredoxin family protein [Myxococcales bacterium]|nr:thioredoxin family protein [Myxococcales bacterium]